jgi:hypothetical protein
MGRSRTELQAILQVICPNVYFQPPADMQIQYPAVVYEMDRADTQFADDRPFNVTKQYSLQLISQNPDESIFDEIAALPMCAHERHFVADNLNHEVFNIYF